MKSKQLSKSYWDKITHWLHSHQGLVLILTLVILLRIPTLFEPHRYADEEIYLTLGQGIRKGLVLYRDIHDNKPPLLYLTAALAGNVFWFRFILMIAHAIQLIFFWKLAELIFKPKTWAIWLSTLLFGVFTTIPIFEGNIANGENFMMVPATIAVYLLFLTLKQKNWRRFWVYLLIGVLFSTAFLYKIPVAFDFLGIMLFWWLFARPQETITQKLKFLTNWQPWLVIIAFVLPIGLSIAYYAYQGAFEPYVRSALLQNIGYLSSWRTPTGLTLTHPLVWRALLVLLVIIILWLIKKHLSTPFLLVSLWLIFAFYGALLSNRPYPHYLLEIIPAFSLVIPFLLMKKPLKLAATSLLLISGFLFWENKFWHYQTLPYYQNFFQYVTGQKNQTDYFNFWQKVSHNYQVAEYIKKHTLPEEKIFVWGTEPSIYTISDRLPVGRYVVEYHIVDSHAYDETLAALTYHPPEIIVVTEATRPFPELEALIQGDSYLLETTINQTKLYRYLNGLR